MDTKRIIYVLGLERHPEGGFFRETYRCGQVVEAGALGGRYSSGRSVCTAIYYLLGAGDFSAMHRVSSDEIFHFYAGDAVEMLQLKEDGSGEKIIIGADVVSGHRPQVLVEAGCWQGCRLVEGGSFALMGCTVAPGFEFEDFELAETGVLGEGWPDWAGMIAELGG